MDALTNSHRVPIRVSACALVGKVMRRSVVGVGPGVRNAIVDLDRDTLYISLPRDPSKLEGKPDLSKNSLQTLAISYLNYSGSMPQACQGMLCCSVEYHSLNTLTSFLTMTMLALILFNWISLLLLPLSPFIIPPCLVPASPSQFVVNC